ncbi:hypothetical protein KHU50_010440 [Colletotrichum sp. SAR 10_65]|nr:hypothetical protein KHU50_010440 [Colletotrichum sp. SAR 10_65]KAJ5003855.1 hypothetical protein K4K48_011087 [Colletotrichum sp. SAR 10_66]
MQADGKSTDVEALRRVVVETAARIKALPNWKIQLFCAASIWDDLFDTISDLPVEVIADHSGYDDMEPVIKALAERVPDRLIWGSDWPHTGEGKDRLKRGIDAIEEFRVIDNELIVRNLRNWIGSEETWGKVTVRNPKKFYE